MREIKFRAVMPDEKVSALGFKLYYQNDQYLGSFLRRANTFAFDGSGHDKYGVPLLEQFTGLKDKNGVEIYEGDVVKDVRYSDDYPQKGKVIWDDGHIGFVQLVHGQILVGLEGHQWLEVIGNVHEHPHLLTDSPK